MTTHESLTLSSRTDHADYDPAASLPELHSSSTPAEDQLAPTPPAEDPAPVVDLQDLEDLEFLLNEIEDQIAPLA
jgi:hypothetical protein